MLTRRLPNTRSIGGRVVCESKLIARTSAHVSTESKVLAALDDCYNAGLVPQAIVCYIGAKRFYAPIADSLGLDLITYGARSLWRGKILLCKAPHVAAIDVTKLAPVNERIRYNGTLVSKTCHDSAFERDNKFTGKVRIMDYHKDIPEPTVKGVSETAVMWQGV